MYAAVTYLECEELGEGLREFQEIMDKAAALSQSTQTDQEAIEAIGEGRVVEEALAIAVYCCLRHEGDFAAAVTAAVNHGGDSASTGAITGTIMGRLWIQPDSGILSGALGSKRNTRPAGF